MTIEKGIKKMKYSVFTFILSILIILLSGTLLFAEDIYFFCDKAGEYTLKASVGSSEWNINNNQWVDGKICTFHVSGHGGEQEETNRKYKRNSIEDPTRGIVSYFKKGSDGRHCLKVVVSGYNGSFQDLIVQKKIYTPPNTPRSLCFYEFKKEDFKIHDQNPKRIKYNPDQHLLTLFYATSPLPSTVADCTQDCYSVVLIKNSQPVKNIKWNRPFETISLTENNFERALIKTPFGIITKKPPITNLSLTDIRKNINVRITNDLIGKINYSILNPKSDTDEWIIFSQKKVENKLFPIEVPKISTLNQWKLLFNSEKFHPKEYNIPSGTMETSIEVTLKPVEPKYVKITLKNTPTDLNSYFYIKDNQNMIIFYQQNTNNKFLVPFNAFFNNRAVFCDISSEEYVLKKVQVIDLRNQISAGGKNQNVDIDLQRACVKVYETDIVNRSNLPDSIINDFNINLYDQAGTVYLMSKIADFMFMDNRAAKYLIEDKRATFPQLIFDGKTINTKQRGKISIEPKNRKIQAKFSLNNIPTEIKPIFYLNSNKVDPSYANSIYTVQTNIGLIDQTINFLICIPGIKEINKTLELSNINSIQNINCIKAPANIIISLYGNHGQLPGEKNLSYNLFDISIKAIESLINKNLIGQNIKYGVAAKGNFSLISSLENTLEKKIDKSSMDLDFSKNELSKALQAFNAFHSNPHSLCHYQRSKILIQFLPDEFSDTELSFIRQKVSATNINIIIVTPMKRQNDWNEKNWKELKFQTKKEVEDILKRIISS